MTRSTTCTYDDVLSAFLDGAPATIHPHTDGIAEAAGAWTELCPARHRQNMGYPPGAYVVTHGLPNGVLLGD
ncbi:MAG: hypothetical protein ABF296_02960 [Oceanococcaceae bacterium]